MLRVELLLLTRLGSVCVHEPSLMVHVHIQALPKLAWSRNSTERLDRKTRWVTGGYYTTKEKATKHREGFVQPESAAGVMTLATVRGNRSGDRTYQSISEIQQQPAMWSSWTTQKDVSLLSVRNTFSEDSHHLKCRKNNYFCFILSFPYTNLYSHPSICPKWPTFNSLKLPVNLNLCNTEQLKALKSHHARMKQDWIGKTE